MSTDHENEFRNEQRYAVSVSNWSNPFKALRILTVVITIFAIFTAIAFGFACFSLLTSNMLNFYGSAGIVVVILTGLIGAITVVFLLALAESIKLLLAIESNTRTSAEFLRRKSFERQETTAPMQK